MGIIVFSMIHVQDSRNQTGKEAVVVLRWQQWNF